MPVYVSLCLPVLAQCGTGVKELEAGKSRKRSNGRSDLFSWEVISGVSQFCVCWLSSTTRLCVGIRVSLWMQSVVLKLGKLFSGEDERDRQ